MQKVIELGAYAIVVNYEIDKDGLGSGGSIVSNLHVCDEDDSSAEWDAAVDAIEAMVLGHACAGIDITSPAYLEGLETAVEGCANNID